MEPITAMISGAVHAPAPAVETRDDVRRAEEESPHSPPPPVRDEYIPEEPQEPSGRYWLEKDEDGQPKVYFDDPERGGAVAPEKKAADGEKSETCTGSTDAVDREIENLKKKRDELQRQINTETDARKVPELERKLAQIESELRQKDNDAYRRQHAVFS